MPLICTLMRWPSDAVHKIVDLVSAHIGFGGDNLPAFGRSHDPYRLDVRVGVRFQISGIADASSCRSKSEREDPAGCQTRSPACRAN